MKSKKILSILYHYLKKSYKKKVLEKFHKRH